MAVRVFLASFSDFPERAVGFAPTAFFLGGLTAREEEVEKVARWTAVDGREDSKGTSERLRQRRQRVDDDMAVLGGGDGGRSLGRSRFEVQWMHESRGCPPRSPQSVLARDRCSLYGPSHPECVLCLPSNSDSR